MRSRVFATIAAVSCVGAFAYAGSEDLPLSSLDLSRIQQGWGTAQTNRSVARLPLQIGGRAFTHGIGTHAPSRAVVRLDGEAQRLRALVGVNDGGRNEPGSVEFIVRGDGRELWRSGVRRGGDAAKPLDVPLAGVRELVLEVTDADYNVNSDHADWAEAVITYTGRKPELRDPNREEAPDALYPPSSALAPSPGDTTYHVDPAGGDDANTGTSAGHAWQSLARVNALRLAPGDRVLIAPGAHRVSLKPAAVGTAAKPVVIQFAPGRHVFSPDEAITRRVFVSNSADAPHKPRPIGILVENARHLQILGGAGCELWYEGRMTLLMNDRSEGVTYAGLTFDLVRPTVSEFRVQETAANSVVIQVAEGSDYAIENGKFGWRGDLGPGGTLCQQAIPAEGRCWRQGRWDPFGGAQAEDLGGRRVRLTYASGTLGMVAGRQFHFRNIERDTTSGVNHQCKDLLFRDCTFHALTGMAIVSQFSENITYQRVQVVPRPGTLRTCPAWADALHFSGCRGKILVDDCRFSGLQDDPINVHGTYLRIVGQPAPDQVLVRFMHPQTYGLPAFFAGDEIEFVRHASLRAFAASRVKTAEMKGEREILLTLAAPAPAGIEPNDVVDNVTWHPEVEIRNCTVDTASCRGFLLSSRRRTLVEGCTFTRTQMSAILIAGDAESWFESGSVRDVTIRGNRFVQCGQNGHPVIWIAPENKSVKPEEPVHENIRIEDNVFDGGGVSAKSAKGIAIRGNRFSSATLPVTLQACTDVSVEGNTLATKE